MRKADNRTTILCRCHEIWEHGITVKEGTVAHFHYPSKLGNLRKTTKNITGAAGAKAQTPWCLNSLLFARDHDGAGHSVNCTSVLGNGKQE